MREVELRNHFGVLEAAAELYPGTGIAGEIVVNDHALSEEELDEDALVPVIENLVAEMLRALARLNLGGDVSFVREGPAPDHEVERAIDCVLANMQSTIVRITPAHCEHAKEEAAQEAAQEAAFHKSLDLEFKEEGLKRGLNKEERSKVTLAELLDFDDDSP
jgi:hypothetical protein